MEKAKHVKKREDDCEYFIDAHLASRFLSITRRLSSEAFPAGNRPSPPDWNRAQESCNFRPFPKTRRGAEEICADFWGIFGTGFIHGLLAIVIRELQFLSPDVHRVRIPFDLANRTADLFGQRRFNVIREPTNCNS